MNRLPGSRVVTCWSTTVVEEFCPYEFRTGCSGLVSTLDTGLKEPGAPLPLAGRDRLPTTGRTTPRLWATGTSRSLCEWTRGQGSERRGGRRRSGPRTGGPKDFSRCTGSSKTLESHPSVGVGRVGLRGPVQGGRKVDGAHGTDGVRVLGETTPTHGTGGTDDVGSGQDQNSLDSS